MNRKLTIEVSGHLPVFWFLHHL